MPAAILMAEGIADIRLLRLLQLASPMLPVGAYAYSQGLEWAVSRGWPADAAQVADLLRGLLDRGPARLDVPLFGRLHQAWRRQDYDAVCRWNDMLLAGRGTYELLSEDRCMGRALARLLVELGQVERRRVPGPHCALATMFAAAAAAWEIPAAPAAAALLWAWAENQVAAAVKLIPLGQTDGQRILLGLHAAVAAAVDLGLSLPDEAVGACLPGMAIASARHETQHTRLFRS